MDPPFDRAIDPGDSVIVVAADGSTVAWTGALAANAPTPALAPGMEPGSEPESMAILGRNEFGKAVVRELDLFVAPESALMSVVDPLIPAEYLVDPPEQLVNLTNEVRMIPEAEAGSRAPMAILEARELMRDLGRPTNVTAELLDERDVELHPQRVRRNSWSASGWPAC